MSKWQDYFKGKKITVMGLGLLGRAIGDVVFLVEQGAILTVTDLKTLDQLATSLDQLKEELGDEFKNITFVLGEHRLEDFRDKDFILKAAGVPLESPYIEEARKNNVPVGMSTVLFAHLTLASVVGITGTRGKTTVTHLLHQILSAATIKGGAFTGKKIFLGGNVRGVSTLALLPETHEGDIAVLELDSWQLQGFGDRRISPHVSVFTTFLPDHLNYYGGDKGHYFADKANIFKYQREHDVLVLGTDVRQQIDDQYPEYKNDMKGTILTASAVDVPVEWNLKIPGEHNKLNAALAIKAAQAMGVQDDVIKDVVQNFTGVEGRLQLVREFRGVKIYDDNNATTPDATIAALKSVGSESKNVVLIMGGADKNLEMGKLASLLPTYCKAVVLLAGTGTDRFMKENSWITDMGAPVSVVTSLDKAVESAYTYALSGDVLLFSPAFASFGMFKNEYERGDQFNAIIKGLKN